MAQVDLVLQARAEQVVGTGRGTVGSYGALAHPVVPNCKKTGVSVAKSGSSSTPLQGETSYASNEFFRDD